MNAGAEADYEVVDVNEKVSGVYTFVETDRGEIIRVSYELLGVARELADKLNTFVTAVYLGTNEQGMRENAMSLFHHGADRVIIVQDERLDHYSTRPFTRAVHEVIKECNPDIFLFGATTTGRDLAPRIAARCNVGLSADCTGFDIDDYYDAKGKKLFKNVAKFTRPSFAEAKLATILGNPETWRSPQMGTARPGTFQPLAPDYSREGIIENFTVEFLPEDFSVKLRETIRESAKMVDFDRAKVIISGGNGTGREAFNLLGEIVDAINANGQRAALGASRSAVEAGWIGKEHLIGQSGRTVSPDYYIAVGISGAIQHVEAIKKSKRIVAINHDPDAPIFDVADVGIIDDYQNVIPVFLEKIKGGYLFPDIK
ncbi:MAG: electron transfer flavoprotein subunit alpha/FixB family protein [Candidatus Odinarchaeota archaeon]